MKEAIHIQSEEARKKTINRFCALIAMSSLPSVFIYIYLKIPVLVAASALIALLFLFFVVLNKKRHYKISRTAIIITTNLGILFFSFYLGYNSGIYLYLFAAPLLIYLLFDFTEMKLTVSFLCMYLITYILIYYNKETHFDIANKLNADAIHFIYSFNFCSSFILCFGLITHFANNNNKYILSLINNQQILEKEVRLRNESEDLVKKSLHEREVLLSEVHHRVKNNLAIVSALINMQMDNLQDEKSKQIFEETKNRIYAMALIHNLLYSNNSFAKIDFAEYVNMFCVNISQSYQIQERIVIEQKIDDIEINIKTAVPLALILNELITNSIKHAFEPEKEGKITVGLSTDENNFYKFWVSDTGVGMDQNKLSANSMGIDIIKSLVEQVDGKLNYENNHGSTFTVTLPITP